MKDMQKHTRRSVRRFTFLAGGVWMFQAGGCVVDEALANEILNLVVQAFVSGLSGTTI